MAEKWCIANWKMHGSRSAVQDFSYRVNSALATMPVQVRAVFCPPAIYLDAARCALPENARLQLGAQDCHSAASGAYTGDVSATMLADCGVRYAIVGHSERRNYHHESDALVAEKAKAAMEAGVVPIICIGEQLAEYEAGQTVVVLQRQLCALQALTHDYMIAYEPVWAIGTGKTPSGKEIGAAHATIKSSLGSNACVLYGGSVKPENAKEILSLAQVDGVLIGGASLQVESMTAMMQYAGSVIPAKAGIQSKEISAPLT